MVEETKSIVDVCKPSTYDTLKFRDLIETLEQIRFKKSFQRLCHPDEPEVITIQDIKDIVLFTGRPRDLTIQFINFFHTSTMDKFLRALIVYFQYYVDMGEYEMSPFKNGYWTWNSDNNCLQFESRELAPKSSFTTSPTLKPPKGAPQEVKFRDTIDNLEQIKFKRFYQRICKPDEPEVITIQDIKDVVLFTSNPKDVSLEFIMFFHIPAMDRFLRALIIYFQYYLQIWDKIIFRREEAKKKLYQPEVTILENIVRDDLSDLRSMVAREYCTLLLGMDDAKSYHHMSNMNNDSLSDKDRRLYEMMICYAVRVVWTALQRKYLGLIELEINRMLRTEIFNVVTHRPKRTTAFDRSSEEHVLLAGTADWEERTLLQRSPTTKEILYGNHDHRMLAIGVTEFPPSDERLYYLEAAYSAPEEMLLDLKVRVGLLGVPRKEFDPMLTQRERTSKTFNKPISEAPEFKMPPRVHHPDSTVPISFPKNPPVYVETAQTKRCRLQQRKNWVKLLKKSAGRSHF